jgi:hypothetical protein
MLTSAHATYREFRIDNYSKRGHLTRPSAPGTVVARELRTEALGALRSSTYRQRQSAKRSRLAAVMSIFARYRPLSQIAKKEN